jgi:protein-S-isoprenylcysteine O-methyltransferase Ste14
MSEVSASQRARWWKGARGEWYVVVQVLLILLTLFGLRTLPGWPEWGSPYSQVATVAGIVLLLLGGALALGGLVRLGSNLTPLPYPRDCSNLVESGPYAFVRHPIYSGIFLGVVGWALFVHGWLTLVYAAIAFVFVDVKSRREEKWLLEKFGQPYADYRRRVHKLIPWVY